MSGDSRWDAEMLAARRLMDEMAARHPPVVPQEPFDSHRAINDMLSMHWTQGGPVMAEVSDRWVFARGRRVLCRVNRPRVEANAPVLIWLHGGGWVWASVDTHDRAVREYAAGGSVTCISVDYTLSPEGRFPVAVQECAAVVRRIAVDAEGWGIDPTRIVIGGDSAGGNLAFATALLLRDTGGPALRGILTAYPVTDCKFDTPSYIEFAEGFGLTTAAMRTYWDLYLRDPADRLNPLAAPLRADVGGLPPTLFLLAELDVLRSDGELMAEKMRAAGVDVTLEVYRGMAHGFMRLTEAVGTARTAMTDAGAWLRRVVE